MKPASPVYTQAISAAAFITVVKALLAVLLAFHVFTFDTNQSATVGYFIDDAIPILAILVGAWWASRKVTSLAAPRDIDGTPLSRPGNAPAIVELAQAHDEAIKINQTIDKQAGERRIVP